MERNFNNEFEKFLKENADQYRIYPSSKVWNGIYTALHSRRKWFGLGIILLLVTGSLVTLLVTNSSKETAINPTKTNAGKEEARLAPSEVGPSEKKTSFVRPGRYSSAITMPGAVAPRSANEPTFDLSSPFRENVPSIATNDLTEPLDVNITDELTDQDVTDPLLSQDKIEYPKSLTSANPFNWTIESVVNSFMKRDKKFSVQFTLTPTISYRKLSANKPFLSSATSAPSSYAPLYDINSMVTHKPDLGLEFGFATKYAVAANFRAKAGLQFNINGYDIKAFNSSYEVARIALRSNGGVDSFYALSTHRNFNGYKSDWLHNFYFEISMPVGAEVNIVGDDKVQFGVGGTIQPTYVLGDRAYLLSTDYKNYAEVPWLIRHWNMSAGLETFVSYSTGRMKWQVGPQVRYQLLSSFVSKYPVKENLFDFGLKVGISFTK